MREEQAFLKGLNGRPSTFIRPPLSRWSDTASIYWRIDQTLTITLTATPLIPTLKPNLTITSTHLQIYSVGEGEFLFYGHRLTKKCYFLILKETVCSRIKLSIPELLGTTFHNAIAEHHLAAAGTMMARKNQEICCQRSLREFWRWSDHER